MKHDFCSHCDCRNTDLFAVNQQLSERIESLKAEIECLKEQVEYYKTKSEASAKIGAHTPKYIDAEKLRRAMFSYYDCLGESTAKDNYSGEALMTYEVADMINDCIDNAADVSIQFPLDMSKLREANMIYEGQIGPLYAVVRYNCQKNKPFKIVKYFIRGYDVLNKKDLIVWEWLPSTNFSVVRDGFESKEAAMAALAKAKKEEKE